MLLSQIAHGVRLPSSQETANAVHSRNLWKVQNEDQPLIPANLANLSPNIDENTSKVYLKEIEEAI